MTERGDLNIVVVVLNWNGGDETLQCLRSLRKVRGLVPTRLLADNGSVDGSVERAKSEDPDLIVVEHGSNLGYAGGNNIAVDHAFKELGADWVCLVNSDVLVAADTFDMLLDGARAAEAEGTGPVGAVGPCMLYRDRPEVVWANGGSVGLHINVTQLIDHNRRNKGGVPHDVDYLPGACLMVTRAAWEATGPLDESFFCYLEDADWCVRLRETGQRVVVVPEALAWHGVSISTGGGYSTGRKYMTAVNSVHFLKKHGSFGGWAALLFFDLLLWPVAFVRGLLTGRARGTLAKLRGVIAGLMGGRIDASTAARFARRIP
jgi:hypothetical protein